MKKVYDEYFHIPKHEKIREKVMLTRVATSVCTMIICLMAMGITAYAYFSHNVTSGANSIKAATFETDVQIEIKADGGESTEIDTITGNHKAHKALLEADKKYTVKITQAAGNTAKTGFIILKGENCPEVYHTCQLGADASAPEGKTDEITFSLSVTETTEVILLSHWGTSAYYADYKDKGEDDTLYITNEEEIEMQIAAPSPPENEGTAGEEAKIEEPVNEEPENTEISE